MKYSDEIYEGALRALAQLRETLTEEQRPTLDFVADAIAEKGDRDKAGAAPGGWIDVKDRLPERYETVIVHYGNGKIKLDWQDVSGHFLLDGLYGGVTHWMPLPEGPEGEGGDKDADQ